MYIRNKFMGTWNKWDFIKPYFLKFNKIWWETWIIVYNENPEKIKNISYTHKPASEEQELYPMISWQ